MPAILKKNYAVFNAANFMNTFGQVFPAPTANSIYLAVGKSTVWPNEPTPDVPNNSLDLEDELRNNLLFMKKIDPSDISLVLPRRDFAWSLVTPPGNPSDQFTVNPISPIAENPYQARDYYFRTAAGLVFEVTSVPSNNYAIPDIAIEPATVGDITIADGGAISINYAYTIDALDNPFFTDNWMPVGYNTFGSFNPGNPTENGTISLDQGNNGEVNANEKYSVNHIMISTTLANEFLDIVAGIPAEYRQISIIVSPKTLNDNLLTGDAYGFTSNLTSPNITTQAIFDASGTPIAGTAPDNDNVDVDALSGTMIYIENRVKIIRVAGQSETTKFVIEF